MREDVTATHLDRGCPSCCLDPADVQGGQRHLPGAHCADAGAALHTHTVQALHIQVGSTAHCHQCGQAKAGEVYAAKPRALELQL